MANTMKQLEMLLLIVLVVGTVDALSGTGTVVTQGFYGPYTKDRIEEMTNKAWDLINNCQDRCENLSQFGLKCGAGKTECSNTETFTWKIDCFLSCTDKAFDVEAGSWDYRNVKAKCLYVAGEDQKKTDGGEITLTPRFRLKTDTICKVGEDVIPRTEWYPSGYGAVFHRLLIPCNGEVSRWHFYAARSAPFKALVLRPDYSDPNRWTIVGVNQIPASHVLPNQPSSYEVPHGDRISVRKGDAIGLAIMVGKLGKDNPYLQHTYHQTLSGSYDRYGKPQGTQYFHHGQPGWINVGLEYEQLEPKLTLSTDGTVKGEVSFSADISETAPGDMICKLCLPDNTKCSLEGQFPGGV